MQNEEKKELSKIFYETICKKDIDRTEIITVITNPDFDEYYANLIKINLLNKMPINRFTDTDLVVVNYCYYTTDGKEALKAKKKFRQRLIHEAISDKWTGRSFIYEPDTGANYAAWRNAWTKDAEKHFVTYFGKDPCRWLQKIRERFIAERDQANRIGDF